MVIGEFVVSGYDGDCGGAFVDRTNTNLPAGVFKVLRTHRVSPATWSTDERCATRIGQTNITCIFSGGGAERGNGIVEAVAGDIPVGCTTETGDLAMGVQFLCL